MAKKVFFSFHYDDVKSFRANVVRNHWVLKEKQDGAGYFDNSIWENAKKTNSLALKRLINSELTGTSVTCILIGTYTYQRPWVRYEIFRSIYKCNNLLGVHINSIKDKDGKTKNLGLNPFNYTGVQFNLDGTRYAFITRESVTGSWDYWEEIDSTRFHINDYFPQNYAKQNAGKKVSLSNFFLVYDWVSDNGYNNFKEWVNK